MDSPRFKIFLVAVVLAFFGFVIFNKSSDKTAESSNASTTGSSNYYGKLDSPVTVTEFVDFQCEACYAYYPYVKQAKEKYKDQIRFQVRNFPISSSHNFAFQAARSAEAAARQGKFFEMHDKIFEGQKQWERGGDPQPFFDSYAKEIGLNMDQFKKDRMNSSVNDVINKDLTDIKELGGNGTPSFIVNGKLIKNPDPTLEGLSKVIDDALKEANRN